MIFIEKTPGVRQGGYFFLTLFISTLKFQVLGKSCYKIYVFWLNIFQLYLSKILLTHTWRKKPFIIISWIDWFPTLNEQDRREVNETIFSFNLEQASGQFSPISKH